MDSDHAEAIEEILAKLAVGDALLEIGVCRGHDAHVHALGPRVADRQDLSLLEKSEQLRLHVKGQIADFVQEQRSADRVRSTPGWSATAPVKLPADGRRADCRRVRV